MATFDVPERYLAAAPIIITSPTTRCGTTLVQRLLSASDNAFLYGEDVGSQFNNLVAWFFSVLRYVEQNGDTLDADFLRALAGELNDWHPDLAPPSLVMMVAWVETYFQLPVALAEFGRSIGRPIWGFKWPALSSDTIRAFLMLMPRAKVVYVYRNLANVLMSAKARKFVKTRQEVAAFCAAWAKNMAEVAAFKPDSRVMMLKYEDLVEQREAQVLRLEAFTGVANANRSVFEVKVNTFVGDASMGRSPTQYIEPMPLTNKDQRAILSQAGLVVAEHYPHH